MGPEGGYYDEELHYLCEKSRQIAAEMELISLAHTGLIANHSSPHPMAHGTRGALAGPANLRPLHVHRHLLSEGMVVAPEKYAYIRQLCFQDPEGAVIVMCSLPLGPVQTCDAVRQHLLPHLPIASTVKLHVLREMDTCNTSSGVLSVRDRLLDALHERRR